jgi:hypothetical protein
VKSVLHRPKQPVGAEAVAVVAAAAVVAQLPAVGAEADAAVVRLLQPLEDRAQRRLPRPLRLRFRPCRHLRPVRLLTRMPQPQRVAGAGVADAVEPLQQAGAEAAAQQPLRPARAVALLRPLRVQR